MFDASEFIKRAVKYIVEGIMVGFACYAIPKGKGLSMDEVALIALSAAATFSILDTYVPSMGVTRGPAPGSESARTSSASRGKKTLNAQILQKYLRYPF